MSRALQTLLRLHQAQIDETQTQLSAIVAERDRLHAEARALDAKVEREQAFAASEPDAVSSYGAFAGYVTNARRNATIQDEALKRREDELRDLLSEAFIERKKVEHLLAAQSDRERVAENARELASLDESAVLQAARRDR